ncbi:MAG: SCO family protein [Gammaproteobacteria bacterium]|jgi:protein SCO1/2
MPERSPLPAGTILLFLFWGALLAAVLLWMLPGKPVAPELQGVLRPEPKKLKAFELVDQHRQPFTLERLEGKWSFVFFGYTYCPDICPTTLAMLTTVAGRLHEQAAGDRNVQIVFVSVDPQRDTPEVLADYMEYFNEAFLGVTGRPAQIDDLTRQFGAGYVRESETAPGEYLVSHASSIFLVDPRMQLRATFSPPHSAGTIVEQFRQIRGLF